ncbi:uncharacterized protein LOC126263429 [Schistocerca nitens]|uniref:uncharacterized protein LOC126263427 n=1 Tax=Schistocerca nitens TaxID=7011 RepID=UPI002118B1CD|nr:uncharacterized protein LOC126263427 [Schistocerca nitens]XP_049816479.1 uncharacterized protein LOC126263429 [Schistocerca nitens]
MYCQVSLHPDDRNFQRILWRESPSEPVQEYRLCTLTYGTTPAAFLATRCLQQLALENQNRFLMALQALMPSFYVDDFLGGSAMEAEAQELQIQLTQLLASGGFPLRKWCSNSHKVMEENHVLDRETSLPCHLTGEQAIKTLWILWYPGSDTFQCHVRQKSHRLSKVTKRNVLSTIASIYDLLGLLGPAVIRCKLLLQHLCQVSLDWDEILPSNLTDEWNALAYGACVYVRCVLPNNSVLVSLAADKSRVAPVKQQSLP